MKEVEAVSAYQTTAAKFFGRILELRADLVLDVRLKNESQLCGFTKKGDLAYFVPLICRADYVHDPLFAPDPDLLERYVKHRIDWERYAEEYRGLMEARHAARSFSTRYGGYERVCLIGTETAKRRSHSEVLAALLKSAPGI